MCTTEHAPRNAFRVLERRHGLAEIVERGARVLVERDRINPPKDPGTRGARGGEQRRLADDCPRATPADADLLEKHFAAAFGPSNETCDGAPPANGRIQGAVAGAVGREVAAAAELGVLRHATHAVLVTGSTFSEVAMRWRTRSNQSAPVVVRLS